MQKSETCGKIETNQRWLKCPGCDRTLLRIDQDTTVVNLRMVCRKCKAKLVVNTTPEFNGPVRRIV